MLSPETEHQSNVVFVVDDDVQVLKALTRLLQAADYDARPFSSADQFLAAYDPSLPSCVVLDLLMPGMDGLQLQAQMVELGIKASVVFLTGQGEVPQAVDAMKSGATDFLVKPVQRDEFLAAVAAAVDKAIVVREREAEIMLINDRLNCLTPRQREVLLHVAEGRLNKQIAGALGAAEKTIKVHRARMMAKMGVRTVAELARLVERVGLDTSL